jgi:type I restriction enzyme S subunit
LPGFSGKWETEKLGDVADFEHGRNLPKSDLSEDGNYKCIHYGQLFTVYQELIRDIKSRTNVDEGCFYSKANDVLMPTSDVTPRGLATATCIKEDGVILGGGIMVIRFKSGYDGLYFSYFVSQNKTTILKLVKGSTVFHLYAGDLTNLEINFPSPEEQTAIATILSDMDIEIEKLESQLLKYQNIKQGMMQTLLTGKIRLLTK